MFCRRFGTLLVLVAALLPIQLQAEAITPSVTSDLYLTDGARL